MTYTADAELISLARSLAGKLPAKCRETRERILDLLAKISTAVELANGPLPDRNAHWQGQADLLQHRLRRLVAESDTGGPN